MRSRTRFSRRTFVTSVILSGAVGLVAACSSSASPTLAPSPGASSGAATAAPSPATGQAAASPASPTAAATSTTAAKPSGQPVNLLFWYSWSVSDVPLKYYQQLADQTWAPKHPGSSLKIVKIPENDREAKYTAAFAAGQGPDLFSDMVDIYTQRGIAAELPSELGQRLAENLIPASIPNYQYEGKWRGIPFIPIGSLGLVMFYNADQFKEVGLDPAKPPTTMTELWDDALKLVKVDSSGNVTRSGFAHNFQSDLGAMTGKFYPFLHSYGGRLYDPKTVVATGFVNSPGGVQALQVLKDMSIGPKKVSSNILGLTEEQMARGQASIIFRESSFVGYFQT